MISSDLTYFIALIICFIVVLSMLIYSTFNYYPRIKTAEPIPKVIYITCNKSVPSYVIENWLNMNPGYSVKIYNDEDVRAFLDEYYPPSYLSYFEFLDSNDGAGPIKADFFRICVLNKFGGVYVDSDIEPVKPIDSFLEPDTDLLTCGASAYPGPNPQIIICKKDDYIIKQCIEVYETQLFGEEYDYWGHSIVAVMRVVLESNIENYDNHANKNYMIGDYKVQIILEIASYTLADFYCVHNNETILYNRYKTYDSDNHKFI